MNARKLAAVLGSAAVVGTAIGMTTGLTVAAAAPKPSGATFWFCKDFVDTGNYRMTVRGVFPMEEADAVGFLVHLNDNQVPGGMKYRVSGDDDGGGHDVFYNYFPGSGSSFDGYLKASPQGLEYMREISFPERCSTRTAVCSTTRTRSTPRRPSGTQTEANGRSTPRRSWVTSRSQACAMGAARSR